ncbi:MAG: HD domain-containing protein [Rubrobacteraceae bacterium]
MAYTERFEEALAHAARLHRKQTRKGSETPYINHLLAVAAIVGENGGTEDEVIAALLHDAIEDTGETKESLADRFGADVTEIVEGCSDADAIPKPPWRARKETYIAHVKSASPSVRFVSSADKLHNARAILADYRVAGEELWDRFRGGREGTLWYYRTLVEAYKNAGSTPIIEELDRVVTEIEHLANAAITR